MYETWLPGIFGESLTVLILQENIQVSAFFPGHHFHPCTFIPAHAWTSSWSYIKLSLYFFSAESCKEPGRIHHGSIHGTDFKVGQRLEVFCDLGYAVKGIRYIKCLVNGKWSHPMPTCASKSHSLSILQNNHNLKLVGNLIIWLFHPMTGHLLCQEIIESGLRAVLPTTTISTESLIFLADVISKYVTW